MWAGIYCTFPATFTEPVTVESWHPPRNDIPTGNEVLNIRRVVGMNEAATIGVVRMPILQCGALATEVRCKEARHSGVTHVVVDPSVAVTTVTPE